MRKARIVTVDPRKCTGCDLCRLACSFAKDGTFNIRRSRVTITRHDREGFAPRLCRSCQDAPCLDACPAGAIVRRKEDGRVVLLEERCRGCNMCVMVCPFSAIGWGGGANFACDGCGDLEKCAEACPHGAIRFVAAGAESRSKRRALAGRLTTWM
jgi:Fe-S-cluster-containing hydrogenase component 2